jgi:hypothetical protein
MLMPTAPPLPLLPSQDRAAQRLERRVMEMAETKKIGVFVAPALGARPDVMHV